MGFLSLSGAVVLHLLVLTVVYCAHLSRAHFLDDSYNDQPDSEEYGQHYDAKRLSCKCGWTNKDGGRIIGGKETRVNEYPYMVGVGRVGVLGGASLFCGGVLVTPNHALTAAHCTNGKAVQLVIIVGEHDLTTGRESPYTKIHYVNEVIQHEMYNNRTHKHDIAILVTHVPIVFNQYVGSVCLPIEHVELKNRWVKVTGWGHRQWQGKVSNVLMEVNLKVVDIEECSLFYPTGYVDCESPTQFCTYTGGRDSCQGDSGGPVLWLDPETNLFTLVGIVSFGQICASSAPGVYTQVFNYVPWIQSKIKKFAIFNPSAKTCQRLY